MSTSTLPAKTTVRYPIELIKDEVRQLVEKGTVSRQQTIYTLCRYIPASEWVEVERELARQDYLLRDRIIDLVGAEEWNND